jgi:hypothetical protein
MLWWVLGLWLLSPVLVPIVWLIGLLTRPQEISHRPTIDNERHQAAIEQMDRIMTGSSGGVAGHHHSDVGSKAKSWN